MGHMIQDGRGSAVLARVDSEGHLMTHAINQAVLSHRALMGYTFCAHTDGRTMSTSEKKIGWMQNNSENHLIVVSCLTISAAANCKLTFYGGRATGYTSGGSALTPQNLNSGSGRASVITAADCYQGDDLVLTGQFGPSAKFLLGAYKIWSAPMFDSFILAQGGAFALGVQSLGSGGEAIEAAFRYWEVHQDEVDSMLG